MESTNYKEFIGHCNNINNFLIEAYKLAPNTNLGAALNETRKKNKIINHYWNDLSVIRELRNLLIHERTKFDLIAEPSNEIVERAQNIYKKLNNPEIAGQLFNSKVICFDVNDSLSKVLKIIHEDNYTQFPVFDGNHLVGLLTENGISRWLAQMVKEDIVSIVDTKIYEVIQLEESSKNYELIKPSATVYDVDDRFSNGYKKNNRTLTLLISLSNNPTDENQITGIITFADLQLVNKHF
jgi:CBS domain-containing protein